MRFLLLSLSVSRKKVDVEEEQVSRKKERLCHNWSKCKLGQQNYLCATDHTTPSCTNGTRPVRSCRLAFVTSFLCVQTPGGVVSGPLGVSGHRSRSRQAERQIICLPQNARCGISTGSATGSRRGSPVEGELSAELAEH